MIIRRPSLSVLVGAGILALGGSAAAQVYPSHPIEMVVPFPAGGPTDVIARLVAERMRISLGRPVSSSKTSRGPRAVSASPASLGRPLTDTP